MRFVYHPKRTVNSSASEMEAIALHRDRQGYTLDHQSYVSQEQIVDWLDGDRRVFVGEVRPGWSQLIVDLATYAFISSCLSLLVWFSLKRWIAPLKDLRETMLEIASHKIFVLRKLAPGELRVTRPFNAMLDQIDQLMAVRRRKSDPSMNFALSSQINPPFPLLLDTIWMAEFQDSQRVVQDQVLGNLFPPGSTKEGFDFSDEINHVPVPLYPETTLWW